LKTLICLAILGCHSPTPARVALYLSGQFDAGTTYHVLTTCPTCYELNPALKPFARSAAVFPAIAIGDSATLALADRLGKHHKILRKALVWGFIGLHVWCGVHNIRVAGRYPRDPLSTGGHIYSAPQAQGIVRFKVK
jgi:hypothetical protein